MNIGHFIGLLIAICLILIVIGFVKLTWGFWYSLLQLADYVP